MNTSVYEDSASELTRDRGRAIGSILVQQGRLTPAEVDKIRMHASTHSIRFGDAALQLQLLTERDIDLAIALQFKYPILQRGPHGVGDDVVAGYAPQSPAVEPLRVLRSQISLRWVGRRERKILVVASPGRGEGRSWLAANLATVFAQMGERVLLIDADMRNPRQHVLFNLDNSVGLSALLTGRAGREIVARIDPSLRLFLMPAGILPPNPQELLGRQVFDLVLDLFGGQYDLVILDTPAASETADAQLLASRSDGVLLVVRRHHTRVADLRTTMQNMAESGANVIGSVVTEF